MIGINKIDSGKHSFEVKSQGGYTLLKSVEFQNRDEVEKVLRYLGTLNTSQAIFERKTNHDGKFLFNLKKDDGRLIGHSQLYNSEAGMENGIKNLSNRIASLIDQKAL